MVSASVNVATGTAFVAYRPGSCDVADPCRAVEQAGYTAEPADHRREQTAEVSDRWGTYVVVAWPLAVLAAAVAVAGPETVAAGWVVLVVAANAAPAVATLRAMGTGVAVLSGDRGPAVEAAAHAVGIDDARVAVIRQNFGWAMGFNVSALPLAALGFLDPLMAAVAMGLSSVVVVLTACGCGASDAAASAPGDRSPHSAAGG